MSTTLDFPFTLDYQTLSFNYFPDSYEAFYSIFTSSTGSHSFSKFGCTQLTAQGSWFFFSLFLFNLWRSWFYFYFMGPMGAYAGCYEGRHCHQGKARIPHGRRFDGSLFSFSNQGVLSILPNFRSKVLCRKCSGIDQFILTIIRLVKFCLSM